MHVLVGALVGALVSALIVAGVALWRGRRPTLKDLLLAAGAGAVGGAITAATLGLGAGAATATLGRQVAAFSAGGAVAGGLERTGHNAVEGRPLGDGVATSTAVGAAGGVIPVVGRGVSKAWSSASAAASSRFRGTTSPALEPAAEALGTSAATRAATDATADLALPPPAVVADAAPRVRGFVEALGGDAAPARPAGSPQPRAPPALPKSPAVEAGLAAVHPAPPAWLQGRMADTVAAVRRGVGPEAAPADVERFLVETYEHVREVNALLRALGTRARDLPAAAPTEQALRGVHDFGERASVRRVEELIAKLRREPVVEDGVVLPVPEWLVRLPAEARRAGESTIDVGKLSPHVAAGLARAGKPDPFAIRLHNLSAHHQRMGPSATGRPSAALVEEVADRVNAMRQVRVYRKKPIPFERIEQLLLDDVRSGALPPEAEGLVRQAVAAQRALERSGEVTPYYLLEA